RQLDWPVEGVLLAVEHNAFWHEGWGERPAAGTAALDTAQAGKSVEVLLTRYAKCLDGRQDVANRRIEDLLREYD
ncbi:hypothetical protein ACWDMZ_40440, partial [Streptomyces sp. NPDC000994]